jgi:uncharacterized protein YbjT (DUF2867 family)
MRITVLGATGRQGGATARHLLARGHDVRALVRDPGKPAAVALAEEGAELVTGDMLDRESLERAFTGVDGVFSVQTWRGPGGVAAEREGGFKVADAAAEAGVSHLVYTSVADAEKAPELAHFASKHEIERHIASIGIPATILRPVFFMDNFSWQAEGIRGGKLVQGVLPETRLQMIAVDDIGALAAMGFDDPETWLGRTVSLAGDELTMPQAADIFAQRLGRPVTYAPDHEDRPGGGDEARKMTVWFDQHGYDVDIPALRAIYPPLKDLATYVAGAEWL